ncbi:hypothetical protein P4S72_13550 [Vibrio sp. PP-XX7]
MNHQNENSSVICESDDYTRPTFHTFPAPDYQKIALEEHIESPYFSATGSHPFVKEEYFADVERRLHEYRFRIEEMDQANIGQSILSLTQPRIEGFCDPKKAIEMATRTNDYIANIFYQKCFRSLRWFCHCTFAGSPGRRG